MRRWIRSNYQPCLPLGENQTRITGSKTHRDLARRIAAEGIVLLKNNGVLPLKKSDKIAIFGIHQIDYIKGGTGSGNVVVDHITNLYESMRAKSAEGKCDLFIPLSEYYSEICPKLRENLTYNESLFAEAFLPEIEIPTEKIEEAAAFSDTAIFIISRNSGECNDRKSEKGDFYLDDIEETLLDILEQTFSNVVIVLNVGGIVDVARFANDNKISAVLLSWQGGCEGGGAVADVLCGDVNPSGKLTDTLAGKFDDYPSSETFNESDDYVKYYEDIYVGYRYFETIEGAADKVIYPFGFGLSYTTFEICDLNANDDGSQITINAKVKNIGEYAGREVVQVYYKAPIGRLGKPARELATFKKTKLLQPGEIEEVTMTFSISDMASYDDTGKCEKSAYILEGGDYLLFVGNDVRNSVEIGYKYHIDEEFIVLERLSSKCIPYRLEKRLLCDGSYEELQTGWRTQFTYECENLEDKPIPDKLVTLDEVADGKYSIESFMKQLSRVEKFSLLCGTNTYGYNKKWSEGPFNGWSSSGVANTSGIGNINRLGVPAIMTADGPAGLRILADVGITTTAWPIATMLACTWDPELVFQYGKAAATEVKENNMGIWLAPGMNIHRNPLCGRNFEYYSEDPVLSGKMASAVVKGVQFINIAATPKHFACNNKEKNRIMSDSIVSERALREIYLKGFEIVVKEAKPWAIMTSYNMLNGHYTSANYDLITGILRNEWGYDGCVMSDWGSYGIHGLEVKAGNDVKMPFGYVGVLDDFNRSQQLTDAEVDSCVKRVLQLIMKIDC